MNKKNMYLFSCVICLATIMFNGYAFAIGFAKIAVKVIDESGMPMESAQLSIRFSSDEYPLKSKTKNDGYAIISSDSNDGVIVGEASKDNYYPGIFHNDFVIKKFGRWQPWNKEIIVVMRPIVSPVPMYVRNRFFEIPQHGKEIGFDLMKADWVIPYGQGTHSDFIFKVDRRYKNIDDFDATLTLTFPNKYDGIQLIKDDPGGDFNVGSRFRLPYAAPEADYQPKLVKKTSEGARSYNDYSDENNYIFRVRSELDKNGKLKQAMYGKIRGDIKFAPIGSLNGKEGLGAIGLHYYLNPDYTRNLEFDPKRNLFISLPKGEGTGQP